jgi:hypothetical protein
MADRAPSAEPSVKSLQARRSALKLTRPMMSIGLGLPSQVIVMIEEGMDARPENDKTDYYLYWLDRLERLTSEQLDQQLERIRAGKRFS